MDIKYVFTEHPIKKNISIFEINLEDTFARREKYSSKLDISRSLMRIFETNLEDTFARREKYSSKT